MGTCCSCDGPVVTYHSPHRLKSDRVKRFAASPIPPPSEQPLFAQGATRRLEREDNPTPTAMEDSRHMEDFDDVTTPPSAAALPWSAQQSPPAPSEGSARKPLPMGRNHERCETFVFPTTATTMAPSSQHTEEEGLLVEGSSVTDPHHVVPTPAVRQGSLSSWQVPAQHFQFMGQGHGHGSANNSLRRVSSTNQRPASGVFSLHSASSSGSGRKQLGTQDHSVLSTNSVPQNGSVVIPTAFGGDGDGVPLMPSASCVQQVIQAGDAFNPLIGCGSDSTSCVAHPHHTSGYIFSPQSSSSRQHQGVPSNVFDILCLSADTSKTTQHLNHDYGSCDGVSPVHTVLKRDSVLSEESGEGGTKWRQPAMLPGAVDATTGTSSSSTQHAISSRGFEGGEIPPRSRRRSSGNTTEGGSSSCTQPSQGSVSAMRLALSLEAMTTTKPQAEGIAAANNKMVDAVYNNNKNNNNDNNSSTETHVSPLGTDRIMHKYETQHTGDDGGGSASMTEPYDGVSSVATLRKSTTSDDNPEGNEGGQRGGSGRESHRSGGHEHQAISSAHENAVGQLTSLISFPPESESEGEDSCRRLSQVPYGNVFPMIVTAQQTATTTVSVSDIGSYSTRRRSNADSLPVASPVAPNSNGTTTTVKGGWNVFVVHGGVLECEEGRNPIDDEPLSPPGHDGDYQMEGGEKLSPAHNDLEDDQVDDLSFEVDNVHAPQVTPTLPLLGPAVVGSTDGESAQSPQVDESDLVMHQPNAGAVALRSALSDPFSLHSQHGSPSAASYLAAVTHRPFPGASPSCTGEGFLHAAILPTDCLSSAGFPFLAVASSQSHQQPNAKRLSATEGTNMRQSQMSLTTQTIVADCNPLTTRMMNPPNDDQGNEEVEEVFVDSAMQCHEVLDTTSPSTDLSGFPDEGANVRHRSLLPQFSNDREPDSDDTYGGLPAAPRNSSVSVLCRSTASSSGAVALESKSPHLSRSAHMSQSGRNESFTEFRRQLSGGGGVGGGVATGRVVNIGSRSREASSSASHHHHRGESSEIMQEPLVV